MMQETSPRVVARRLRAPLTEADRQSVLAYRKGLYAAIWSQAHQSGLLDIFAGPATRSAAEAKLGVRKSGEVVFGTLLRLLTDVGALRTYFDAGGERIYQRGDRHPLYLTEPDPAETGAHGTGEMSTAQARQVPQLAFRALQDSTARVDFSERFEPFWRSSLEAKCYATGRDMASREVAMAGSTVVDLACGLGHGLETLAANVGPTGRIIGVEMSEFHVRVSRERIRESSNVEVFCGNLDDGLAMLETGSVDGVTIVGALHFVLRKEYLISEIARITRPGARLAVGNCFMDVDVFDRAYLDLMFALVEPVARPIKPDVLKLLLQRYEFETYFDYSVGSFGWFFARRRS